MFYLSTLCFWFHYEGVAIVCLSVLRLLPRHWFPRVLAYCGRGGIGSGESGIRANSSALALHRNGGYRTIVFQAGKVWYISFQRNLQLKIHLSRTLKC